MSVIPCSIIRGGTSKGVFVLEEHLPSDQQQRDQWLLALMGSPDPRQINGLGGADPLTSKVAIVSRSRREGIDVEYESVEVGIAEGSVNHGIMCGNLLAGVGSFAMAEGLIKPQFPLSTVRIYCRNNQKTIVARVPVPGDTHHSDGESQSQEVTGESVSVGLVFETPGGAVTGKLLPTGEPVSSLQLNAEQVLRFSVVDAGTLYAFIRAEDLGVSGLEEPTVLDANQPFRATVELVREKITDCINQHATPKDGPLGPRRLKVAIVSRPQSLQADTDIVARVINPAKVHKAYAVSGGICLAAASAIKGTLVNEVVSPAGSPFLLRIAHPSGVLSLVTQYATDATGTHIAAAEIQRTARIIMRGMTYVPLHWEHV
jgi:methylitaconate Delta-isomerase